MNDPLVALIVVNWNGCQDTLTCLDSISKNDYKNIMTILVDNASTDNTVEEVRKKFPGVLIISNPKNVGYGAAANRGIERALLSGAKYVFPLNNDMILEHDCIIRGVEILDKDENVGAVAPKIFWMDQPDMVYSAGMVIDFLFYVQLKRQNLGEKATKGKLNAPRDVDAAGIFLIRGRAIEKSGMFDEDYFLYLEDVDFCLRIKEKGYRIVFIPDMILRHKGSASVGGHGSQTAIFYNTKNRFILWKKHLSISERCLIAIFFFTVSVPIRLIVSRCGRQSIVKGKPFIQGILAGIKSGKS